MNVYEYFNSMQLGLPITTVISNYLVDLKVRYKRLISYLLDLLLLWDWWLEVQSEGQADKRASTERL